MGAQPDEAGHPLSAHYDEKVALYHEARSPEVVAAVEACLPPGGRLLDIGCSTGNLLRRFRSSSSFLAGTDVSSSACAAAREVADVVVNAPIESKSFPFDDDTFDVVVCADVLEHLPEPTVGLRKAIRWCRPGGAIVVSVPNIAYWEARLRLLRGTWTYEPTGIFDDGHLRFFTLDSLETMLGAHGLDVTDYRPVLLPLVVRLWGVRRLPSPVCEGVDSAWRGLGRTMPKLFAYQHVFTARVP